MTNSSTISDQTAVTGSHASYRERWVPLGLLFVSGFWNHFMSPMGAAVHNDWRDQFSYAVIGTIFVQQALCAVWGAWSTHSAWWRFPTGVAASLFCALTLVVNGEVVQTLISMLLIHLVMLGSLCFVRWWSGFVMTVQTQQSVDPNDSHFNLRYLFLWTSVAALLTTLGKLSTFGNQLQGGSVLMALTFTAALVILLVPPVWLYLYLLSNLRLSLFRVLAILVSGPLMALFAALIASLQIPNSIQFWSQTYVPFLIVMCGALVATIGYAFVFRWAGYRVYRRKQASHA